MSTELWPWAALLLLGAAHGANPGMGWLFAVALGLQERSGRVVWRALLPLAGGHAAAVGVAVAAAAALGSVLPPSLLRWLVAAALCAMGVRQLVRHRHPRGGGMRVTARDLAVWSFLMATAHGAGLMAVPFAQRAGSAAAAGAHTHGAAHAAMLPTAPSDAQLLALLATVLHTASYLLVTGGIAAVVYRWLGVRILRSAWLNLDLLWAVALVLTAVVTVLA